MLPQQRDAVARSGDDEAWITPVDGARLTGRSPEVLVRYLREGRITGEQRRGRWYLPRAKFLREIARL